MTWERLPVDDVGYFSPKILDEMDDNEVRVWAEAFESRRYGGWRNVDNRWRECLGLDSTRDKTVLDYGCGFGIESLQFARNGCDVICGDINPESVGAAVRVLSAFGHEPRSAMIREDAPFFPDTPLEYDVFYSNGVLHHTPFISDILRASLRGLRGDGEIRLMLYSDRAWVAKVGGPLPGIDKDVRSHPKFRRFVRAMDGPHSTYADWYSPEKVGARLPFLRVISYDYIAKGGIYCALILAPR